MKQYSFLSEAFDKAKIDAENQKNRENFKMGAAGAAVLGLNAIGGIATNNYMANKDINWNNDIINNYKDSLSSWNNKLNNPSERDWGETDIYIKDKIDYANSRIKNLEDENNDIRTRTNIGTAAVGAGTALLAGLGVASVTLRSKRQRLVFEKVMTRFPDAASMCKFLESQNIHPQSLTPDAPDNVYATWVKRQIVKQGRWWNIILHFLYGMGVTGTIVNAIKYKNAKDIEGDEMVYNALSGKKKYNSVVKQQ